MFNRPSCESPRIIFNRSCIKFLIQMPYYFLAGKRVDVSPFTREIFRQDFDYRKFNRLARSFIHYNNGKQIIDWQNLEESFCGYDDYGNKNYLFMAVPCGHCSLCCDTRQNDFVFRAQMENQTSVTRPVMVTLTYDPHNLPFSKMVPCTHFRKSPTYQFWSEFGFTLPDYPKSQPFASSTIPLIIRGVPYVKVGEHYEIPLRLQKMYEGFKPAVVKRDVQLFLKRLRIMWKRSQVYSPTPNFRYVCFAELGKRFNRPHYHFIFWNVPYNIINPYSSFRELSRLKRDILACWRKCIPSACQVEIARNAASYVSKYISKNLSRDGVGFMLASNRHGGIGYPFLKTLVPFLRKHPQLQSIEYTDKWSGKSCQCTFGRYALKRVFPSPISLLPESFKKMSRYNDYLLSVLHRLALRYNHFENITSILLDPLFFTQYQKYLYHQFYSYVQIPKSWLHLPTEYEVIRLMSDIEDTRNYLLDTYNRTPPLLPSVDDLDYFARIRNEHFKYMHANVNTDDSIYFRSLKVKQKQSLVDSKTTL